MKLAPNEVHIWTKDLSWQEPVSDIFATPIFDTLSDDEKCRAYRFKAPLHQQRFVTARSALREILSKYLSISPKDISFAYSEDNKPYLGAENSLQIKFNLSHSDDIALYALNINQEIGIDIEAIRSHTHDELAKRYFSVEEFKALSKLPEDERRKAFIAIWTRKEALIKANGKGLRIGLQAFTVSLTQESELITLENQTWKLQQLQTNDNYQAAVAYHPEKSQILHFTAS